MLFKFILQFVIGVLVGIYGYLLPSYINLAVLQLATRNHSRSVWRIISIISIIEIPYCFFCMKGMKWFMSEHTIQLIVQWVIVLALLLLAFLSLRDAGSPPKSNKANAALADTKEKKLLLVAIFNPFQLSAWAIWGSYFIEKDWFTWNNQSIFLFSVGASLGVLIILWIYAILGRKLVDYLSLNRKVIDYSMCGILFILAIIQIFRNLQWI
ncbi:MAG: LysE family transporter [Chitinophagaceae bacterium]|nr:LysE family transporter [Chitinophagaceae bacterium]